MRPRCQPLFGRFQDSQVAPHNVLQHRTLSAGLRSYDDDLRQVYRVLDLSKASVCAKLLSRRWVRRGLRRTPTVVKTSWSLLTSVIRPGSFTLMLQRRWLAFRMHPRGAVGIGTTYAVGFTAMAGESVRLCKSAETVLIAMVSGGAGQGICKSVGLLQARCCILGRCVVALGVANVKVHRRTRIRDRWRPPQPHSETSSPTPDDEGHRPRSRVVSQTRHQHFFMYSPQSMVRPGKIHETGTLCNPSAVHTFLTHPQPTQTCPSSSASAPRTGQ